MDITTISLILSIFAIIIAMYSFLGKKNTGNQTLQSGPSSSSATLTLQLQAYERLVLLTERIALPNLVGRLTQPGLSAIEMKVVLTENIKQEFDYNSTQQIYVSPAAWAAVHNLKEQYIMLINQVAGSLPENANAADLSKRIMEVMMAQPEGAVHDTVLKVLNLEAKKIM